METPAQAAFLTSAGCAYAQGYHYSPPVDAAAMTRLLRARVIRSDLVPEPAVSRPGAEPVLEPA